MTRIDTHQPTATMPIKPARIALLLLLMGGLTAIGQSPAPVPIPTTIPPAVPAPTPAPSPAPIPRPAPTPAPTPAPKPAPMPTPATPPAPEVAPQAVVIGPQDPVAPRSFVFFDASQSITGYPLQWTVQPDVPVLAFDKQGRSQVYGIIPPPLAPGVEYIVTVTALGKAANGDPIASSTSYRFVVAQTAPNPSPTPAPAPSPAPTPAPGPTPTPAPDPGPARPSVAGHIWATLVYASGEPTTLDLRTGPIANSASDVRGKMATLDASWVALDDRTRMIAKDGTVSPTTVIADLNMLSRYTSSGGSPTLFLQDATGKILAAVHPAPTSTSAVLDLIGSFRSPAAGSH